MKEKTIHYYYVDEAGDTALFNRDKKQIIFGQGASKFFMLGIARLHEPETASRKLEALRQEFATDPYLRKVPSFQTTAQYFHAKDDYYAIKRDVFRLIETLDVEVHIAVRRKTVLAKQAALLFKESGKKLTEAAIYDDLVRRLLPGLIHKADENHILFSERGRTFTNHSLNLALKKSQEECLRVYGVQTHDNHFISQGYPRSNAGLQIVDYLLWAVQRLFEREEDFYFEKLRSKYSLIIDVDDTRKGDGERYEGENLLTLDKISSVG